MQLYDLVTHCQLCVIGVMHPTADNRVRKFQSGQTGFTHNGFLYQRPWRRYILLLVRHKENHQQTDDHCCDELSHVVAVLFNYRRLRKPFTSA
jgi:hypothetical protein